MFTVNPTITLPAIDTEYPYVTFPVRLIKVSLTLSPLGSDRSRLVIFDLDGAARYAIDDTHRDWVSALHSVGRLLSDDPDIYKDK